MMVVSNGGAVSVASNTIIGSTNAGYTGSNNSVLVTGAGSLFSNGVSIVVGNSGGGTLTIGANGAVIAPIIYIAQSSNSTGTLNYGAFGGNDTNVTLGAGTISFGNGSGSLNLNQADTFTFITDVSGNGSVNQLGAGTTILTGNASGLLGTITIGNGALQIGNGTTNGSPTANAIVNNASLILNPNNTTAVQLQASVSGVGSVTQTGAVTGTSVSIIVR
jgi:T5SS/PEP-CTERM-associated repeat protein